MSLTGRKRSLKAIPMVVGRQWKLEDFRGGNFAMSDVKPIPVAWISRLRGRSHDGHPDLLGFRFRDSSPRIQPSQHDAPEGINLQLSAFQHHPCS